MAEMTANPSSLGNAFMQMVQANEREVAQTRAKRKQMIEQSLKNSPAGILGKKKMVKDPVVTYTNPITGKTQPVSKEQAKKVLDGMTMSAGDGTTSRTQSELSKDASQMAGDLQKDASQMAGDLSKGTSAIAGDLKEGAEKAAGNVSRNVSEAADSLKHGAAKAVNNVEKGASEMADSVSKNATKAVNSVEKGATKAVNGIKKDASEVADNVSRAAGNVSKTATKAVNSVEKGATKAANGMKRNAAEMADTVSENATKAVNSVEKGATKAVNGIKKDASEMADTVSENATKAVNSVEKGATKAVNGMKRDASKVADNVSRTAGNISKNATKAVNSVEKGASKVADGLTQIKKNGITLRNPLTGKSKTIPMSKIKSVAKQMAITTGAGIVGGIPGVALAGSYYAIKNARKQAQAKTQSGTQSRFATTPGQQGGLANKPSTIKIQISGMNKQPINIQISGLTPQQIEMISRAAGMQGRAMGMPQQSRPYLGTEELLQKGMQIPIQQGGIKGNYKVIPQKEFDEARKHPNFMSLNESQQGVQSRSMDMQNQQGGFVSRSMDKQNQQGKVESRSMDMNREPLEKAAGISGRATVVSVAVPGVSVGTAAAKTGLAAAKGIHGSMEQSVQQGKATVQQTVSAAAKSMGTHAGTALAGPSAAISAMSAMKSMNKGMSR